MERLVRLDGIQAGTHFFHAPDGHSYHLNRIMSGGRLSYRCIRHYTGPARARVRCRGRVSATREHTDLRPGRYRHNHDPDWTIIHERRFRSAVMNECRRRENASLGLKEIYHKVRRDLRIPRGALVNICYRTLRPSMFAARNEVLPPIPHTLNELVDVLENPDYEFLTQTLDGLDNIYLGKFGQTNLGTRCVLFASRRALGYLQRNQDQCEVMSDGTFSKRPQALLDSCAQVWTLLLLRRNHIVVVVRALMQTKSQACYEAVLRAIREAAPGFNPHTVMVDFELPQAAAWEAVFPNVIVIGCFFHSSKAISLHAKILGLAVLIRDNEEVDSIIRSLCALGLLPHDQIIDGLISVTERCVALGYWDQLSQMFEYMRNTWTTPSRLRLLSVYGRPNRTSNACESANASLGAAVGNNHPNVYTFLYALNDLEDITDFEWGILEAGRNPSGPRRASALANDEAIQGFQLDLQQGFIDVGQFLTRASRRVQNVYNIILNL